MNPTVMLALGPATQSWMVVTMAEQNTEQRQFFFRPSPLGFHQVESITTRMKSTNY